MPGISMERTYFKSFSSFQNSHNIYIVYLLKYFKYIGNIISYRKCVNRNIQ